MLPVIPARQRMGIGSPTSAPEGGLQGGFGVVAGQQEVTLPGHEVRDGGGQGGGQDPALLRGYQAVVLAVPDLDGHPDLVQRHAPGPGFTDLARRVTPVGTLGGGGAGEARSPRLHEILAEQGFSRELRLALCTGSTLWGALVLLREHGRRPFSDEEVQAALAIAQPLTRAVKRINVRPRGQVPPPLPPGVVIVGGQLAAAGAGRRRKRTHPGSTVMGGLRT